MHQETLLPLFDRADAEPEPGVEDAGEERERTIDERFAEWAERHPDVLALYRRFAEELRAAGHEKFGSKLIVERIRWEKMTSAHRSKEEWAINNVYTSRLSRWLVSIDPSFAECLEFRRLKNSDNEEC